jgi:hypothetical protein
MGYAISNSTMERPITMNSTLVVCHHGIQETSMSPAKAGLPVCRVLRQCSEHDWLPGRSGAAFSGLL